MHSITVSRINLNWVKPQQMPTRDNEHCRTLSRRCRHRRRPQHSHVAASIGLVEFTKEIIERKPEAALCINRQGLTPLHLACAHGRLALVRELLQLRCGSELCRVTDENGLPVVHTATANEKLGTVEKMMRDREALARERTWEGENILHLFITTTKK